MRGLATAAILLIATAAEAADCVSTNQLIAARSATPNRVAGPIVWTGSSVVAAKTETGNKSIWVGVYDEQLNATREDVRVVAGSHDGPMAFLWTGSDLGVFYEESRDARIMYQRVAADGTPIGGPVPIPHGVSADDELDFAWDPIRQAHLILHRNLNGNVTGLWLTGISRDGSVQFDRQLYTFLALPAHPRVVVATDGTIGVFFESSTVPGTSYLRIDAQDRYSAPVQISSRPSLSIAIAPRGTEFGIAKQTSLTGGKSEIRWLVIDTTGATVVSERVLVSPRGVDVAPIAVLPARNEWALAYRESVLGFPVLPGDYRLRRFTQTGTQISDTLFSSDRLRGTALTEHPFIWTGAAYVSSAALFVSQSQGSDSYLLRHCPLTAAASPDRAVIRLLDTVNFTASASGGTPDYSYVWDFGDNTIAEPGRTVSHRYDRYGTYTVTLTATDIAGGKSITTTTVRVVPGKSRAVR